MTENKMETIKQEVALQHKEETSVANEFGNAKQEIFTSINDDGSIESKATVFNAMNDTDYSLRDFVGQVIKIKDFVAHKVDLVDETTGEKTRQTRCVFIDENGKTYGTISKGINQSMINLFGTVGFPNTWENPIPLKIMEKKGRKGFRFLTIGLAFEQME